LSDGDTPLLATIRHKDAAHVRDLVSVRRASAWRWVVGAVRSLFGGDQSDGLVKGVVLPSDSIE
jgi:hypothetical protein